METKDASVKEGHNLLSIYVSENSYVEVRKKSGQWMATEKTAAGIIRVNLPPGEYVVETDGKIESMDSAFFDFRPDILPK